MKRRGGYTHAALHDDAGIVGGHGFVDGGAHMNGISIGATSLTTPELLAP